MEYWILAALGLYLLGEYLPSLMLVGQMGVLPYLASRDAEPEPGRHRARLMRAARNYRENLPVFVALGLLSMTVPGADRGLALLGAQIFVIARAFYIPAYYFAIPVVRSTIFLGGWFGMVLMAVALL